MPDGLITVDDLREIFAIDEQIGPKRFDRALSAASRRLRSWVGDAAYDDALSQTPVDLGRADDLELAEAHLTMGFAVLGINTALRTTGVVRTEKVEGNVTITYHSPGEITQLQQEYLDTAEMIARPYMVTAGTPPAPAVVEAEERTEGSTILC